MLDLTRLVVQRNLRSKRAQGSEPRPRCGKIGLEWDGPA
jgi:hypothetical protein